MSDARTAETLLDKEERYKIGEITEIILTSSKHNIFSTADPSDLKCEIKIKCAIN